MALPSRLAIPAFLGLILASTGCSGCDDDPAPAPPPTGKAGSAGAAGKAGAGGSAGGSAGKAGSSTGGSSGTGGTGGAAGTGGSGGSGGANAGNGGTAGSAGGTACGPATGNGTLASATAVPVGDARLVFDATPSPDGCSVYFTGVDAAGIPAFFKSAVGGTATRLGGGGPLQLPSSIATNSTGGSLYIADPEGESAKDTFGGAIFTVSSTGGTPEALPGTTGKAPSGVTVARLAATDVLYFTGREADGKGAVYSIPAAGGTATLIYSGDLLPSPSAVAVTDDGSVYVADSILSAVFQLKGNTATFIRGNFKSGFPAGIAVSRDGKGLLVGTRAAASRIDRIDLTATTTTSFTTGLEGGNDPAGLHRALAADVYSFVDQGVAAGGGIYLLKP